MNNSNKIVCVTGATGFIARHIISQLLERDFTVRGTIRSLNESEKLYKDFKSNNDQISFFMADLSKNEGWNEALDGCDYLIHVATPKPLREPDNEDDLIIPAREGTLRILNAALKKNIKRTVITSSVVAISYGHNDKKRTYTLDDWADLSNPVSAYTKSKTLAERAAWKFYSEYPDIKLTTINPDVVLGPMHSGNPANSLLFIKYIIEKKIPAYPRLSVSPVDVRDVAKLHIEAMLNPATIGKRLIFSGEQVWVSEFAKILKQENYKIFSTITLPSFIVRILSNFDKSVKYIVNDIDRIRYYDTSETKKLISWQPFSLREMLLASAKSLI